MMQISVAIPTYNAANYLREAIESVLKQTCLPFEIIVVDDGSTDHTRQVCESLKNEIRYIYQPNDGSFGIGARASAMNAAKGEWIALLDHDDLWLPTKLERQIEAIKRYPQAMAIFTQYRKINAYGERMPDSGDGPRLVRFIPEQDEAKLKLIRLIEPHDAYHAFLQANPYCPSSALIHHSFLTKHPLPDKNRKTCADWELWLSIARHYRIATVEETLTEYRFYPSNYSNNRINMIKITLQMLEHEQDFLYVGCDECVHKLKELRYALMNHYSNQLLNEYHAATKTGNMSEAFVYLRKALQASPRQTLQWRRFLALIKNGCLGFLRK